MTFRKGDSKPANSGRRRGTPNKRKVLRVADVLAEGKVNPIQEVLKLLPLLEPKDRAKIWLELQSYTEAKPREYEPDNDTDEPAPASETASTADLLSIVSPPSKS